MSGGGGWGGAKGEGVECEVGGWRGGGEGGGQEGGRWRVPLLPAGYRQKTEGGREGERERGGEGGGGGGGGGGG